MSTSKEVAKLIKEDPSAVDSYIPLVLKAIREDEDVAERYDDLSSAVEKHTLKEVKGKNNQHEKHMLDLCQACMEKRATKYYELVAAMFKEKQIIDWKKHVTLAETLIKTFEAPMDLVRNKKDEWRGKDIAASDTEMGKSINGCIKAMMEGYDRDKILKKVSKCIVELLISLSKAPNELQQVIGYAFVSSSWKASSDEWHKFSWEGTEKMLPELYGRIYEWMTTADVDLKSISDDRTKFINQILSTSLAGAGSPSKYAKEIGQIFDFVLTHELDGKPYTGWGLIAQTICTKFVSKHCDNPRLIKDFVPGVGEILKGDNKNLTDMASGCITNSLCQQANLLAPCADDVMEVFLDGKSDSLGKALKPLYGVSPEKVLSRFDRLAEAMKDMNQSNKIHIYMLWNDVAKDNAKLLVPHVDMMMDDVTNGQLCRDIAQILGTVSIKFPEIFDRLAEAMKDMNQTTKRCIYRLWDDEAKNNAKLFVPHVDMMIDDVTDGELCCNIVQILHNVSIKFPEIFVERIDQPLYGASPEKVLSRFDRLAEAMEDMNQPNKRYMYRLWDDVAKHNAKLLVPHVDIMMDDLTNGNLCHQIVPILRTVSIKFPEIFVERIDKPLYGASPEKVLSRFDQLAEAMNQTNKTDIYILWDDVAKHNAKLLVPHVDMMMDDVTNDKLCHQIVQILGTVSFKFPEIFVDKLDKLMRLSKQTPHAIYTVAKVVGSVGRLSEEQANRCLGILIDKLKSTEDMSSITILTEMKRIGLKYLEILKKYRGDIEPFKTSQMMGVPDWVQNLIDFMEGRSLEALADDVEDVKDDVEKINNRVTETEENVDRLDKTVTEQGQEIDNVKNEVLEQGERLDELKEVVDDTIVKVDEIDHKTITNAPKWSRDISKLLNPEHEHDWRFLAIRLGFSGEDVRNWALSPDPTMALLAEWYTVHKSSEATYAVLTGLQDMGRDDAAVIVEEALQAANALVPRAAPDTTEKPPRVFISYQWDHQPEVKAVKEHLERAGFGCWLDIGQMGGGDSLFAKINDGMRAAKVVLCMCTEKYSKSENCNKEVNLANLLNKPIIPVLIERIDWPPSGSMSMLFAQLLYIQFFTNKEYIRGEKFWEDAKFAELLGQINYHVAPDPEMITDEYRNWMPNVDDLPKVVKKVQEAPAGAGSKKEEKVTDEVPESVPEVFISYQWDKQQAIKKLYSRLTSLGFNCWLDILQMGGGDSLYSKIDKGIRNAMVVVSSVTSKYALSANCRREVSLSDALRKPIIPILLETMSWPPEGPMSMTFAQLLYIDCSKQSTQAEFNDTKFDELVQKIREHAPVVEQVSSARDKTEATPKPVTPKPEETKQDATPKPEETKQDATPKPEETEQKGTPKPEETKQEATPKPEDTKQDATPKPEETKQDGTPKPEETKQDATPKHEETKQDATPKPEETKQDATPIPEETKQEATPKPEETKQEATPKPEETKQDTTPKSEETKQEATPKPEETKQEATPKPEETKQDATPKPEETKQEATQKPEETKQEATPNVQKEEVNESSPKQEANTEKEEPTKDEGPGVVKDRRPSASGPKHAQVIDERPATAPAKQPKPGSPRKKKSSVCSVL